MKENIYKIAILADFPWNYFENGSTGRGGGQVSTWLTQLAEQFSKVTNYEIHWISLDHSRMGIVTDYHEWGGQFYHRIPAGKISIDLALGFLPSRILLKRKLKQINPDLIHCWGTERSYPIICNSVSCPTILSMQGVLSNLLRNNFLTNTWFWQKLARKERYFIKSADVITCESQWARDRVKEVVPDADIRLVEYGVNQLFYSVKWEPDLLQPYALFVGSLVKWKGVEVLLEALKIGDEKLRIKFLGDGPLSESIKNCGIAGVEFYGTRDWKEVQGFMQNAICLVHPTLADSSPNVVKEARVIGLPVITTIHGGQIGYIHNGGNGIIVEPLEPVGLAEALRKLLNDTQLAQRMGASHHTEDRAYLHPSLTVLKFLELYDELLSKKL